MPRPRKTGKPRAEAEAASKRLQGEGIAGQRKAIMEGYQASVEEFQKHVIGVPAAEVRVTTRDDRVLVRIRDDGKGFDPARVAGRGYGVTSSLVERMDRMGGRATVTSAPGEGTTILLEWPDDRA